MWPLQIFFVTIYILDVVKRNPLFFHSISKIIDFFLLHLIYIYTFQDILEFIKCVQSVLKL